MTGPRLGLTREIATPNSPNEFHKEEAPGQDGKSHEPPSPLSRHLDQGQTVKVRDSPIGRGL